jgi:hypothetical protein
MHNFKENGGSYVFGAVAVEQPAQAIVKYSIIMREIKLCKGVRVTARSLDEISIFAFAKGQICLPLCPFFTSSSHHHNYKRTESGKRPKKSGKISETHPWRLRSSRELGICGINHPLIHLWACVAG